MSAPVVFISAASVDLKKWRDHLHTAFSRAGFRVLTQDQSLRSAPGDVHRLLSETIHEAHCVIHLAGMGYGSHATDPFPDHPAFQCSWTQFEYYYAHQQKKDVIAFVCAPNLSEENFIEKHSDAADLALKQHLQKEHRARVASGQFTGTPLDGVVGRTSNESADNAGELLESIAAAVGTLHTIDREHCEKAQQELRDLAETLGRIEGKVDILAEQMAQVQAALAVLQQNTDPKKDPISQWPQERLEEALAAQMEMKVEDLHAILAAGRTSLDALVAGQALLASGNSEAAGEKFDLVLQQEQAALQRMKQAWEGKAQIAFAAVKYEEALSCYQKAAALVDKAADPLAWTDAQTRVTFIFHHLARHKESEPLAREIIRIREEKLGPDHPKFATALNNLAQLLQDTNSLSEAEPLMRRALKIVEASFGPDHPEVAIGLNNLAGLLLATNRLREAEPHYRRALKINEASHSPNHPMVALGLHNLAWLLKATNRLDEAEPLLRRALKINEASYGPDHPMVAIALNTLALLLKDTNRLREAEPLMRRALKIDEASYGPNHPKVAIRLNNLAPLLQATNRLEEAEPLMRRALKIDEASYGPDHPHVATGLNNLTSLYYSLNRLDKAEPLMRRALKINEASYGPDHPHVATCLNNLAQLLQAPRRLDEAEPLMRRALKIDEASYGPDHPHVAIRLSNLASVYYKLDRLREAEPLMWRALKIDEASFGLDDPNVAIRLNNLAQLLKATKRLNEAEPLMRRHLLIFMMFRHTTGHEHPNFKSAVKNYTSILRALKLTDEQIAERLKAVEAEAAAKEAKK